MVGAGEAVVGFDVGFDVATSVVGTGDLLFDVRLFEGDAFGVVDDVADGDGAGVADGSTDGCTNMGVAAVLDVSAPSPPPKPKKPSSAVPPQQASSRAAPPIASFLPDPLAGPAGASG